MDFSPLILVCIYVCDNLGIFVGNQFDLNGDESIGIVYGK